MTRRWGLTAGYRWALAAAVPLGAVLGIVVGVVVLILGNADWREFSTLGTIVSSFAGYVAFGAVVAAIAALGAALALATFTRFTAADNETGSAGAGATRILVVAAGASMAVIVAGFVFSAVTRDSTTPYLVLFLAVPTAAVAGSAAAVVEGLRARGRRQRREQRERSGGAHGEFSPSTDRGARPTVET